MITQPFQDDFFFLLGWGGGVFEGGDKVLEGGTKGRVMGSKRGQFKL